MYFYYSHVLIAVYNPNVKDGDLSGDTTAKIAYLSQSDTAVTTISVPGLAPGEYTVAVGGQIGGDYSVYRAVFTIAAE